MLWRLSTILFAAVLTSSAAVLPESFAGYNRGTATPVEVSPEDQPVWTEYGLQTAEKAEYAGSSGSLSLTAWRFSDPTGAFAAFQWLRPHTAQSGETAAQLSNGVLVARDNYLIRVEGARPHPDVLAALYGQLPDRVSTSLPPLSQQMPKRGRVPNSERYLLGNASLSRFAPGVPAELAAVDRGAEGQTATYRLRGQELQLTVISYPTPQMAIAYARRFAELEGMAIHRAGPLLAVAPNSVAIPGVVPLLQQIEYRPNFTWSEHVPKDTPQDAARMILAIFALAGFLIVFALAFGIFLGGSRVIARRLGLRTADEEFTSLHLER